MRKGMSVLLCLAMLLCAIVEAPTSSAIDGSEVPMPSYPYYEKFMEGAYLDIVEGNRIYLKMLEGCAEFDWYIEKASMVIGENLSVKRCTEILANLATMMNYELEDAIMQQASFDATMTIEDYALKALDVVVDGVDAEEALESATNAVLKAIPTVTDISSGLLDVTIGSIEELEILIHLLGDYQMQFDFLISIYQYSENEHMREAAFNLLRANEEVLLNKLKTFNGSLENVAEFLANDVFLDKVAERMLSDPSNFGDNIAYAAELLGNICAAINAGELVYKAGMLLGDFVFGTTNIYIRYNEMKAMRDIRNALLININENDVDYPQDFDGMNKNTRLIRMLLYVDMRGEYCAHEMIASDGQLLSLIKNANGESLESNYKKSLRIIEYQLLTLETILEVGNQEAKEEVNKRLVRMDEIDDDGRTTTTTFAYDDKGYLISTTVTYSNENTDDSVNHYTYDSTGRLLTIVDPFFGGIPTIEYHYDDNGYLVEISGKGEGGGGGGIYVNDAQGRPIRYTIEGTFYSSVTEYTYPDEVTVNTVTTSKDYYGNVTVDCATYVHTYDGEGRMLSESRQGSDYVYTRYYRYDYKPFVATYREGELPELYSIVDVVGETIWSLRVYNVEDLEVDEHGYVTHFVGTDLEKTYEFFYEDDESSDDSDRSQELEPTEEPACDVAISEEAAYRIACEYWDYTVGDVAPETGYELYVTSEYGEPLKVDSETGRYYYCILLRWMVVLETGYSYLSTCDIVYVDTLTGECAHMIN